MSGAIDDLMRAEEGTTPAASLHDEIVTRLRDMIVEGTFSEGARIPERELCLQFGISRTPLREALKVLAAEGLIELLPNRGARVRAMTEQDITHLFEVMSGLESLAGRLACLRVTDDEIARIEALHYDMYRAYLQRDLPAYSRLNQAIHEAIVAVAANPILTATYRGFSGRIRRVRYAANLDRRRDRWGEAVREHEQILDALRRRDGEAAAGILYHHLRNKLTAALEYLEETR
ncbi:GntR family transcriptional regulator [Marinivivus vitaminiproducens]|uniref:GntR family transcriptional regulator n=1 Tax=Marinivivus vitaminiproducens TaxID=3035935 RepID=UPI0027A42FFA|nr:GntR family transcriptional regulator [Geminicoccaceae bacterium SCSIO 64248]